VIELESVRPVSNLRYMKLYIALASTDEHIYIFFSLLKFVHVEKLCACTLLYNLSTPCVLKYKKF
jgi:hypothetical protein